MVSKSHPNILSRQIELEIENRLGMLPSIFASIAHTPSLMQSLWDQTQAGYLDNPLPSLFKEQVFAYLSRYSDAPYCMVRHSAFLVGLGYVAGDTKCHPMTPELVVEMLQRTGPSHARIEACLELLRSMDTFPDWPATGTPLDNCLFDCVTIIFSRSVGHKQCVEELQRLLGDARLANILSLIACIRTTHLICESLPRIEIEGDAQTLIDFPPFKQWLTHYAEKVKNEQGSPLTANGLHIVNRSKEFRVPSWEQAAQRHDQAPQEFKMQESCVTNQSPSDALATDLNSPREESIEMVTDRSPEKLAKYALVLGTIGILCSIFVGMFAYKTSRSALIDAVAQQNLANSKTLVQHAMHRSKPEGQESELAAFQAVIDAWSDTAPAVNGSFMCMIRKPGIVAYHSDRPNMVGRDASSITIKNNQGESNTVATLLTKQLDAGGLNTNIRGIQQLVGYAYYEPLDALVATHIPLAKLDTQIHDTAMPWAASMALVTLVLFPSTLLLLHEASRRSMVQSRSALSALGRREAELQKQFAQLDQIYRDSPIGLCLLDTNLQVLRINSVVAAIINRESSEVLGKNLRNVLPEFASMMETKWQRVLDNGEHVMDMNIDFQPLGSAETKSFLVSLHPIMHQNAPATGISMLVQEITQRKRHENKVRMLSNVFTDSINAIFINDSDGTIVDMNKAAERQSGWTRKELIGNSILKTIPPREHAQLTRLLDMCDRGSEVKGVEGHRLTKDGELLPVSFSMSRLAKGSGKGTPIATISEDISRRKQAEFALTTSEKRLQGILRTTSDVIISFDTMGVITSVNGAIHSIFGYRIEEVESKEMSLLLSAADRIDQDQLLQNFRNSTVDFQTICQDRERVGIRKDGTMFPISVGISYDEELQVFACIVRDISEMKELERNLLRTAEQEQLRIGQDLHDGVQQQLVGLGMLATSLREAISEAELSETKQLEELAQRLVTGISNANADIRDVCRGLVPMRLKTIGLAEALKELASRTSDFYGVDCVLQESGRPEPESHFEASHLYRITQESITNAVKHGGASRICIHLKDTKSHRCLEISNDGTTVDRSRISSGLGTRTMFHRARLIGGVLTISAEQSGGTSVTCDITRRPEDDK